MVSQQQHRSASRIRQQPTFSLAQHIVRRLVTDDNPQGTITNSDLELAGGLLHLDALTQCFDIRERTVLSKGDNLSTTFWE